MDFDIGLQRAIFASMQSHFEFARAVAAQSRPSMMMPMQQPSRTYRTQLPPPPPAPYHHQTPLQQQQRSNRRDIAPTVPSSGGGRGGGAVVTYGKRSTLAREGILPTTRARATPASGPRPGGKGGCTTTTSATTNGEDSDEDEAYHNHNCRDDDDDSTTNNASNPRWAGDEAPCSVPGWISHCSKHARVQRMQDPTREGGGQMLWITDELYNGMVNVLPEVCLFVSEVELASGDAASGVTTAAAANTVSVQVQSLVSRGRYGCAVVGWRWVTEADDAPTPDHDSSARQLNFVGVTIHFDPSGSVLVSVDEFAMQHQRDSSGTAGALEKVRVLQPPTAIRLLRDRVHVAVTRVSRGHVRVSLQGSDDDFLQCGAGHNNSSSNHGNNGCCGTVLPIVATSGGRFSVRGLKLESNPANSSSAVAVGGGRRPDSKRLCATATSSSSPPRPSVQGRPNGGGAPPPLLQRSAATTDLPPNVDRELALRIEQEIVDRGPCVEWDDVVGMSEAKRLLKEAIVLPLLVPELFTGVLQPWKGVLMYGPPGTGKTMLAKAVAASAHTTFFNMSASVLLHKHFGESEKMIRTLFQVARARSPSTIFFDEIDAIVGTRGGAQEHDAMRRVKAELLTQIDGLQQQQQHHGGGGGARVMILATTNRPWDLDDAMRRRLEKRIYIGLPDQPARVDMLTKMCRQLVLEPSVQLADIAGRTEGYCGADINHLVRNAGMMPLRRLIAGKTPDEIAAMKQRGEAVLGAVTAEDFELALQSTSSSVRQEALKEFEDWSSEFASL